MTPRTIARAGRFTPTTLNEAERTVDVVVATENDVGDGVILSCNPGAFTTPAVVPLLLDHRNQTSAMAGRLENIRAENGQVVATARLTDAPAAEQGWQLARGGCAVSCRAVIQPADLQPSITRGGPDVATRWVLPEASFVPIGADRLAVTRSLPSPPTMETTTTETETTDRAQERQELVVRRAAAQAQLPEKDVQEVLTTFRGRPQADALIEVARRARLAVEAQAPTHAGHPAQVATGTSPNLTDILAAKLTGTGNPDLQAVSLARALTDVVRRDPIASRGFIPELASDARIIERAWSTSDFAIALQSSAERVLLEAYNAPGQGVRAIASTRPLTDFREVQMLRFTQFSSLEKKLEGGEYRSGILSEEDAAKLKADEYGKIVTITRKAVINDDLGMAGRILQEMGRSAQLLENELLYAALGTFTWSSANTTSGANFTATLASGTLKLRRQTDAEGKKISFTPRLLLVAPEQEALAVQELSDRIAPTTADNVTPFSNVRLEVDALLPAGTAYLVDTAYQPLVLGTIGAPAITQEENFDTGSRRFRVQHDAAAAAVDNRSIVKITISG